MLTQLSKQPKWLIVGMAVAAAYALAVMVTAGQLAIVEQGPDPERSFGISILFVYLSWLSLALFQRHEFWQLLAGQVLTLILLFSVSILIAKRWSRVRGEKVLLNSVVCLAGLIFFMGAVEFVFLGPYAARCGWFETEHMSDGCYREVALSTNDSALCSRISDEGGRDTCRSSLAGRMEDRSICETIERVDYRLSCIAKIEQDVSLCLELPEKREIGSALHVGIQSGCVIAIALQQRDISLCEVLEEKREYCEGMVSLGLE